MREEAQALFGDLLISVTTFFRDPDAFQVLAATGHPAVFDDANPTRPDAGLGRRLRHR